MHILRSTIKFFYSIYTLWIFIKQEYDRTLILVKNDISDSLTFKTLYSTIFSV